VKIPNAHDATVDRGRLVDYLINPRFLDNAERASFFRRMGFHDENWADLSVALRRVIHCSEITETIEGNHGTKYIVNGALSGADGVASICTVWIVEGAGNPPRFVTAYPEV
jgi:hypothetical protein